jgi:hypothetical protein
VSPAAGSSGGFPSRRAWILSLVEDGVQRLGRAVRTADLIEYLAKAESWGHAGTTELTPSTVAGDLLSLVQTGDLIVAAKLRGGAGEGGGSNLYLPARLAPSAHEYLPREPLTWLDLVAKAFDTAWAAETQAAMSEGRLPRPVETAEVRRRIRAMGGHPSLDDPQLLVNAMRALARGPRVHVRKVSGRRALWLPAGVEDADTDLNTYGSDPERLCEAARRAMARLRRPAVTRSEIAREMHADASLSLGSRASLYAALADACKYVTGGGVRSRRALQLVRVGRVNRRTYYAAASETPRRVEEARRYVAWLRILADWSALGAAEALEGVISCRLPTVAAGRARLLLEALGQLGRRLAMASGVSPLPGMEEHEVKQLTRDLEAAREAVSPWSECGITLLGGVDPRIPGWTDRELVRAYAPICPAVGRLPDTIAVTRYVGKVLRRVPNPDFRSNHDPDPRRSVRFLFDMTDALLHAARHWGGREARLQASVASETLGPLRDARFVTPGLASEVPEERIRAAACLAFLEPDPENLALLEEAARADPDPGVRQVALWAYGFAGGANTEALLARAVEDSHPLVRDFAREASRHAPRPWPLL